MGTAIAVIASFILGAVMDHFLEARSAKAVTTAIKHLEDSVVAEIRKLR
jgi:hypothetical protein